MCMTGCGRGRGAAWSPTDLTPLVWLDASQLGLANNDPVAEFTDYSGNARHFVQSTAGNKPLFKSAGINGLGAVEGDGTDDAMTLAAFGAQATWWGFIVFRPITMGAAKELWSICDFPASTPEYQLLETDGGTTININQGVGPLSPSLTIANNTDYAFLVKGTATTMHIYTSGSTVAALTGLAGTTPNWGSRGNWGMRFFNRGDGACPFNVRIGEFVFNSGTITGDPEVALWEYANAKWGTAVPTFTP